MKNRALHRARRFYQLPLRHDEAIRQARTGYAGGTGRLMLNSLVAGTAAGLLYAAALDGASLPSLVLGACAGIIAGYYLAERAARRSNAPGATTLVVMLTSQRLLTMSSPAVLRSRVLRSIELDSVEAVKTRRYPIGQYHRYEITTTGGTVLTLVVTGRLSIEPVNAVTTSG
jgi:hypothetical protein